MWYFLVRLLREEMEIEPRTHIFNQPKYTMLESFKFPIDNNEGCKIHEVNRPNVLNIVICDTK